MQLSLSDKYLLDWPCRLLVLLLRSALPHVEPAAAGEAAAGKAGHPRQLALLAATWEARLRRLLSCLPGPLAAAAAGTAPPLRRMAEVVARSAAESCS